VKLRDNPVYRYGLRIHWRGWRLWILPVLALAASAALTFAALAGSSWGQWLNVYVSSGVVINALTSLVIPAVAPLVIVREYEAQTFESLRISTMTTAEIAFGKCACALVPFLLAILATVPMAVFEVADTHLDVTTLALVYVAGVVRAAVNTLAALYTGARYRRAWVAIPVACAVVVILLPILWGVLMVPVGLIWASATSSRWSSTDISNPVVVLATVVVGAGIAYLFWIALKANLDRMPGEQERRAFEEAVAPRPRGSGGIAKIS
jgi:hypothetical protein